MKSRWYYPVENEYDNPSENSDRQRDIIYTRDIWKWEKQKKLEIRGYIEGEIKTVVLGSLL